MVFAYCTFSLIPLCVCVPTYLNKMYGSYDFLCIQRCRRNSKAACVACYTTSLERRWCDDRIHSLRTLSCCNNFATKFPLTRKSGKEAVHEKLIQNVDYQRRHNFRDFNRIYCLLWPCPSYTYTYLYNTCKASLQAAQYTQGTLQTQCIFYNYLNAHKLCNAYI